MSPAQAKKRWIAGGISASGILVIDRGAERALRAGKSLLPAGVKAVIGRFERGDAVVVKSEDGRELARGLVAYGDEDAKRLAGRRTGEIETLLGYRGRDEMIHRGELAFTGARRGGCRGQLRGAEPMNITANLERSGPEPCTDMLRSELPPNRRPAPCAKRRPPGRTRLYRAQRPQSGKGRRAITEGNARDIAAARDSRLPPLIG